MSDRQNVDGLAFLARSPVGSSTSSCVGWLWLTMCLAPSFALAHDHGRPELNDWFTSLRSADGAYCCDGADATSIDDPDWKTEGGHNFVRLSGAWVPVPDSALVKKPNIYGPALVWPGATVNGSPTIRCFMQGMLG